MSPPPTKTPSASKHRPGSRQKHNHNNNNKNTSPCRPAWKRYSNIPTDACAGNKADERTARTRTNNTIDTIMHKYIPGTELNGAKHQHRVQCKTKKKKKHQSTARGEKKKKKKLHAGNNTEHTFLPPRQQIDGGCDFVICCISRANPIIATGAQQPCQAHTNCGSDPIALWACLCLP